MSHYGAFWHQESFNRFMQDSLPQLLASRLPLIDYQFEATGPYTCQVTITLEAAVGEVEITYPDLPKPDHDGFFVIDGNRLCVQPIASGPDLATATIDCVGEHLYNYVAANLGEALPETALEAGLIRTWLRLDTWIWESIGMHKVDHDGWLNYANWMDRASVLRHILIPNRERAYYPNHIGRVCPFETPEGSNMGRIMRLTTGSEIRDGKIVIVDSSPEAGLGVNVRQIPFLEHNDPLMLLMGVNMMRQWLVPPDPEPALVQTGYELDAPDFWCGRNLLTAFINWGGDTYERGIVISQSAAQRLSYPHRVGKDTRPVNETSPYALEPGDKLSHRHGVKGIVSRILPDDEMPHLSDGTPIDIIYHLPGLPTRRHTGMLREAVMGRIARAEGKPAIVPPFHAPAEAELRQRLASAGLPEDGMETLTDPNTNLPLARRSTVGWVYWGRLVHTAHSKIQAATEGQGTQRNDEMAYFLLRNLKAFELVREHFNTRAANRAVSQPLSSQLAAGPVVQATAPTPHFTALQHRLAIAGIKATLEDAQVRFSFASPPGDTIKLARPVPHPWLSTTQGEPDEMEITRLLSQTPEQFDSSVSALARGLLLEVGVFEALSEYGSLIEANRRLRRLLANGSPKSLVRKAYRSLLSQVQVFFAALLKPDNLRFNNRVAFSGRAVIAPGATLSYDGVGLPEEIAWTLFGPLVVRELGDAAAVEERREAAVTALDKVMARSWVVIHRTPSFTPTTMLAFRPVRDPGRVIRIHPFACDLLNADFDGDQAAVFLPLTEGGQREAETKLSIAAHLTRDPDLIASLCGLNEAILGLARLSRTSAGQIEINKIAGSDIAAPDGFITRATLTDAMNRLLKSGGAEEMLNVLDKLMARGFEAIKQSGASMSPFLGSSLERITLPSNSPDDWEAYTEDLVEQLTTQTDFDDPDLGPQLLAVHSGARRQLGSLQLMNWLGQLAGVPRYTRDAHGQSVLIRHGYSEGLTPSELYAEAADFLAGHLRLIADLEHHAPRQLREANQVQSFHVLGRAGRAEQPGRIFARAAASGESDPLTDLDARLFVGLPG